MYIAIEGTKGTGKSTLLENLEHKLQQEGIDFQMLAPTKAMPKDTWWKKLMLTIVRMMYISILYIRLGQTIMHQKLTLMLRWSWVTAAC